ncbi:MAG: malto-oligosyltrehalose trehalohydrolase [Candidatus Dormibacteraeota bacterium]|nr:malto-oligosyltrehalose trehalohydrolase [Candidatus Dormibacteraeota bacterium]
MTRPFRVWAPNAAAVHLEIRGERHPMAAGAAGWFSAELEAHDDDDYMFVVDGGENGAVKRCPDPRSHHQPEGVHGPSRLVDHSRFAWTDAGWRGFDLRDAVLYELHVGTFTAEGTFTAAIERLDHIVSLGVNAVELMPVAEFPGVRGWGYDGVDLFAPHHAYGGPDGLKSLVDACHKRGLAVVMDVVYNHVGPEGDYLGEFGPYFTSTYSTPWGAAVNFDGPDSDAVREFVVDNALMWVRDYHCDGLRLDAVHAIIDTSAVHLLEQIASTVGALSRDLGRTVWVVAESDLNDPRLVRDISHGGDGLTAQWSDDFHHSLHVLLTGESAGYYEDFTDPDDICVALRGAFVNQGTYSRYRRRTFGRPIDGMPLTRFLGYSQNHDQVGNRAAGERLAHLVGAARARMAAALTLLSPFVPLLFQGEEWAASTPFQYFTDFGDSALRRAVSAGRRREFIAFGWDPAQVPDPEDPATFTRSVLRWDETCEGEHASMLRWYRDLIALRRATPGLRSGDSSQVDARYDAQGHVLVYANAGLVVACNLGSEAAHIAEAAGSDLLMSSAENCDVSRELPTESVAIWRRPRGDAPANAPAPTREQ